MSDELKLSGLLLFVCLGFSWRSVPWWACAAPTSLFQMIQYPVFLFCQSHPDQLCSKNINKITCIDHLSDYWPMQTSQLKKDLTLETAVDLEWKARIVMQK